MSKSLVVIMDPFGVIDPKNQRVLDRHKNYQEMLKERSNNQSELLILSRSHLKSTQVDSKLAFISYASFAMWLLGSALWTFKNRRKIRMIVSGDPWLSAWYVLAIRFFICRNAKVQIQLHGDFTSDLWRRMSWRNAIRFPFLKPALISADNIRVVSNSQIIRLRQFLGGKVPNLVLAPLEFKVGNWQSRELDLASKFRIGVVGRLHADRGVFDLVRALDCLRSKGFIFETIFAGDGPARSEVDCLLQQFNLDGEFLGSLNELELEKAMDAIDILFSFAPLESYGLAIREAVCRGLRVLAIENTGTRELIDQIGSRAGVVLITREWDCESLNAAVQNVVNQVPDPETPNYFSGVMLKYRRNLIDSWLN